jgi:hypothetical protein
MSQDTATAIGRQQDDAALRRKLFMTRAPQIARHREKFHKARDEYEAAIREIFPLGATVWWMHTSKSEQHGTVILHGHYARIRVRNNITMAQLWIEPYQILQYLERNPR